MLDYTKESPRTDAQPVTAEEIDALTKAMSTLSDEELEVLEDDLNFFAFTGIISARIEGVLANAGIGQASDAANSNADAELVLAA